MRLSHAVPAEDLETRDRLVLQHVGLVKSLANRLAHRVPSQVDVGELISVGVLGLIEAAGRYEAGLGVPFDAFARRRIQGAMLDALRDLDWAPRSVRRARREVDSAIANLRHELGREPDAGEIAARLNLTEREYDRRLDDLRSADLAAVRQVSGTADRPGELELAIDPDEGPHVRVERAELRARLAKAISALPERERQILALYYEEELTLAEIGQVIGVSESRVSQLRTQAIARLRAGLADTMRAAHQP